ncbi:SPOR domain-containing protein [Gracilimonas tropica]|uniref:SPOR domain-containing protein n=1 Tax=Gracilimonas tropica TaxID=454600 RepID=UPI00037F9759|nr:SPOR domain-containing protein [Gracilimonas tropica]
MKNSGIYSLLLVMLLMAVQACGPSEEERRAAEQARLDSLRQVEEQRIAEMMQARQDSIDRAEEQKRLEEEAKPQFAEDGTYAVQVGAFRSEESAMKYKNQIADREYPHTYVVKVGEEATGDIWFRLRVGFFAEKAEAEQLGKELGAELNTGYWVSKVERTAGS